VRGSPGSGSGSGSGTGAGTEAGTEAGTVAGTEAGTRGGRQRREAQGSGRSRRVRGPVGSLSRYGGTRGPAMTAGRRFRERVREESRRRRDNSECSRRRGRVDGGSREGRGSRANRSPL
jgi:hypothetical protein